MLTVRRSLVICVILLALHAATECPAQWIHKPSTELYEKTPGLVHETFLSSAMNTTVGYSVVLPPSYESSSERYPVVYWLHGGGGNECSALFTAKAWHDLYQSATVAEVILVYPNGYRSGYMDHYDGKTMVESMIVEDLIPRIDARYRTVASRAGRAVHGSSMGASGALKFATKYPDLFCTAIAYGSGAIDLENSKNPFILEILERNLNSDPDLIRQNNTYRILEQNHDKIRSHGITFLLICGGDDPWYNTAVSFVEALQARQIAARLTTVPKAKHDLPRVYKAQGRAAAIFQDHAFRKARIEQGLGNAEPRINPAPPRCNAEEPDPKR